MFTMWIAYCLLISGLLGLAAFAGERALGHYRKPQRWVWVGAIIGSTLLPAVAFVAPGLFADAPPVASAFVSDVPVSIMPPVADVPATVASASRALDAAAVSAPLGWAWALCVMFMSFHLGATYRRLRAEMKGWTPGEILDSPVLVSSDRGPAVVGLRRAVIVMPTWISELEEQLLRLVFLHEREHQKAGDHRLYALGIGALLLMPWNLALWWQVARLRLAIELDCDRRVLGRGIAPRDYAEALLAVGSRVSGPLLAAASFAERRPSVERRIRRMGQAPARLRAPRTFGASGVAALALVLVFLFPPPMGLDVRAASDGPDLEVTDWTPPPRPTGGGTMDRPAFIPHDRPPRLENSDDVLAAMRAAYPADLRASGEGGRVELWLYIDEEGDVARQRIKTSSGVERLDAAAAEVGTEMRFRPAMNRDQPRPVWVSQWITFQPPARRAGDRFVLNGVLQPKGWSLEGLVGIQSTRQIDRSEAIERFGEIGRQSRIVEVRQGRNGASVRVEDVDGDGDADLLVRPPVGDGRPGEANGIARANPLIVIDGEVQPAGIDPSELRALDIDNIEILKGDAAIARYGERAAHGAVVIETKGAS